MQQGRLPASTLWNRSARLQHRKWAWIFGHKTTKLRQSFQIEKPLERKCDSALSGEIPVASIPADSEFVDQLVDFEVMKRKRIHDYGLAHARREAADSPHRPSFAGATIYFEKKDMIIVLNLQSLRELVEHQRNRCD